MFLNVFARIRPFLCLMVLVAASEGKANAS